jgi:transposase
MGEAARCEARIRVRYETEITEMRVFAIYETSGWTIQEITFGYLEWLAEHIPSPTVLLLDLFAAHRDEVIKEKASTLSLKFVFLPPGVAG